MHGYVHSWTIHVLNQEWDYEMAEVALECVGAHVPTALIPACKAFRSHRSLRRFIMGGLPFDYSGVPGQAASGS